MNRREYVLWWIVTVLFWILAEVSAEEVHDGWMFIGMCVVVWATYQRVKTYRRVKRYCLERKSKPSGPEVISVMGGIDTTPLTPSEPDPPPQAASPSPDGKAERLERIRARRKRRRARPPKMPWDPGFK